MPQPTSDQNSSRRKEKWLQNISTMGSNRSVDKEWIRVSKKDGSFQRKERKGQVDSDHYMVQVDSARDPTPLTGRTAQCYMVKQKPSVGTVPTNRLEDFHTVKTQGYNHMLSILRGNNTTSLNRNSILSLHMKGLEQLNGLIHRSPTNKPALREHKQNTASLMGVNCQSSERLDSLWKGHLKTFSDTIPSKSISNASLGFVQAQKMRTSRHRHPRDRSLQNSEILVEPTKSYQMWLPKVSVESDTSRSQQNILSCSWSSLTGHQRRSKWIGHQREPDRLWQHYASGIPTNDDMTNSKSNRNNHMLGALSNAVPEPVSNGFPCVSAKTFTTPGAPPPVGFRSLENPPKILTASDQKKFPKSQTVVPSLDSITEDHQLPVNLASPWTNHIVFRSNPELKPTKHPVHEVVHSDKLCETDKGHSTPRSRTPKKRTKIPSSNVVTKRATSTTFSNSVFDASVVPSKEQSDNKCHGISPPTQQGHGPIAKVATANLESTPRVDLNGTKKSDEADSKSKSSWPLNPSSAVNRYGKNLTAFERQEVESYSEIWFLGLQAEKIHGIPGAPLNAGYDDEHGSYLKVTNDHLAYRYEVLETLGKGSFGRVVRAKDHRTGNFVAVKIIRNKKRFHQQAQIEVTVLEELKKVDSNNSCHIIHIRDHFVFRDHLCIVFDLMGQNLYEVLKKNDFRGFTMHSLRKIATKLLSCLCALRKRGIIHCDLKPENILIGTKNSSDLCVIDFGSSCYTNKRVYTYIQSRFYRAPEIILGLPYGTPIDIWSFGCILPELFTGRPLFPGENENEQLACIMEVFGQPPENILEKANRRRIFFDSKGNPRNLVNSKGRKRLPGCRTLQELVKSSDPKFLDLIQQCLRWNPDERITPEVALNHDWFREVTSQAKC